MPKMLWLITALWASLLLGASVLWPMSYGYDEPQHIDMAYVYSAHPFHFYGPGALQATRANVALQGLQPGYPPNRSLAAVPLAARGGRPSFAALGGHGLVTGGQPDQMVQHPPLYYWLEAVVLRLPGVSGRAWDVQVWLMRLLSVLLLLPLPLLCWATTRRLLLADRGEDGGGRDAASLALLAAAVPLTVPNLIRDGSSVNNDVLLILTTSVLLYLLSRVLGGDLSRRTAAGIAVSLAAALLTKGFALVLPPVVLAAYLLVGWRRGRPDVRAVGPPLAVAAVGGVVGGLWWLRNLVDYGTLQINGFGAAYERVLLGVPDNRGTLTRFAPQFITDFISRIWGGIGLADRPSPGPFVVYGWFFLALVGIVAALFVRAHPRARLRAAVLAVTIPLTMLVVAQGSFSRYRHWSNDVAATQGRYLYSVIVVVAALAVIGWSRVLQPPVRARLLPAVLIGAVVTNAAAWVLLIRTWYQPAGASSQLSAFRGGVHSLLRWSPLPSVLTILLVGVLPAIAAIAAVRSAYVAVREPVGRISG